MSWFKNEGAYRFWEFKLTIHYSNGSHSTMTRKSYEVEADKWAIFSDFKRWYLDKDTKTFVLEGDNFDIILLRKYIKVVTLEKMERHA